MLRTMIDQYVSQTRRYRQNVEYRYVVNTEVWNENVYNCNTCLLLLVRKLL